MAPHRSLRPPTDHLGDLHPDDVRDHDREEELRRHRLEPCERVRERRHRGHVVVAEARHGGEADVVEKRAAQVPVVELPADLRVHAERTRREHLDDDVEIAPDDAEQQVARERADQLVEADRLVPEEVAHDHHHREPEKQRGRKVVRDDGRRRQRRRQRIERDRERDRRQREHHGQPPFPALLEDDQQDGDGDCSHEQIVGKARSRARMRQQRLRHQHEQHGDEQQQVLVFAHLSRMSQAMAPRRGADTAFEASSAPCPSRPSRR